ncbi:MAG: hypothetical protein ACTSRG_06765 [Candidatus Helarchaeota archaeon]
MVSKDTAKILGFFSIIFCAVAWATPYISNVVGIICYWIGSPALLGAAILAYYIGISQNKQAAKINIVLSFSGIVLFVISSVLGIIYSVGYFYLDDLVELFITIETYFIMNIPADQEFMIVIIYSIILMRNPSGERIYEMFFTNSIVGLVLASIGFLFIFLVIYFIITNKVEKKAKPSSSKRVTRKPKKRIKLNHCPRCKAPLSKSIIEDLMNGKVSECEYCKSAINPSELY